MQKQILSLPSRGASALWLRIKTNPWLTSLLGLVFLATICYAFWFQIPPQVDAHGYDSIGWNLATGNNYRTDASSVLSKDGAIVSLGPGYEFFLAAVYLVFGHGYAYVWVLQAALHTVNTWFVYRIAEQLLIGREKTGAFALIGAALFGLHPDLIQIAAMLMTETLFIFCLLGAAYYAVQFIANSKASHCLSAGIFLGLDVLIRPTALLFIFLFLAVIIWKKRPRLLAAIILLQILIIGPWTMRNYVVYQKFIFTTTAGGSNFWIGNNPLANGEIDPAPEIAAYLYSHNSVEAEQHGWEEVRKFILTDPGGFIRLQFVKTMKFFSVLRTSAWWWHLSGTSRGITFVLSSAFSFLLLSLGAYGMWLAFRFGSTIGRALTIWGLLIPASVIPFIVETRYRYPMYPFLAILAAWAVWQMWSKRQVLRPSLVFGGLILINAMADAMSNAPDILDRLRQLLT
jgi:hypothetical protein